MSKAFVNENSSSDQEELVGEGDGEESSKAKIPPGGKNYITPAGHATLKAELHELIVNERPKMVEVVAWAASNGDRSENADYLYGKKRLREIDRRIHFLQKRLDIAEVVDPNSTDSAVQAAKRSKKILFGANVVIQGEDGVERRVQIVGIDETDARTGRVSWISPIGQALLQATEGESVVLKTPKGQEELEILKVTYGS